MYSSYNEDCDIRLTDMGKEMGKRRYQEVQLTETEEEGIESEEEIEETRKSRKTRKKKKHMKDGNFIRRFAFLIKRIFGKTLQFFCPLLLKFFTSKSNEYRAIKAMFGFPFGLLYGYVLHKLVLQQLNLTPFTSSTLLGILCLFLGLGFATSVQVRCICFLVVPTFFGKTGRAYVSTYTITLLISGPIENLLANAHESMRVLSCVATLSLNMTTERFKLMFSPVKDVIKEFSGSAKKIHADSQEIEKSYKPIDSEVKSEDEVKKSMADIDQLDKNTGGSRRVDVIKKKFKNYKKGVFGAKSEGKYGTKAEVRCEEVFTTGVRACRDSFGKAYNNCHKYLPLIGYLLCWPMKLTFICDLASSLMGRRSCNSDKVISPGFGESVDTAGSIQKEFDKDFEVQMQYKLVVPEEKIDQLTPEDVGKALENKFDIRKRNFEFMMSLLNRLLTFMFLLVFHLSRKYCDKYLRIIEYDNTYLTSYFRRIDTRRRAAGKRTLLPLKKGEKFEILDPFQVKLSVEEKGLLLLNLLRLAGEILTISVIITFDRVFYELLMLIQRHAHIEYRQTGAHHLSLKIHGNGFIGKLIRNILKGFDKKHNTDTITTTAQCLPLPTKVPFGDIINIYLTFLIIIFLMIVEAYGLRLRRAICSFFFPKREKKRTIFLYNDRLKKRKSFMHYMRHHVKKMSRKQAIAIDTGVLQSLRYEYPKCFSWLGSLGLGKRKCLICDEIENKHVILRHCPNECPFVYCLECWADTEETCYVCNPDEESDITEDEFSSS